MRQYNQTTIAKTVPASGIGLHSGRKVRLALAPAPENTGILFRLVTESGVRFVSPTPQSVADTGLATTLAEGEAKVSTVEHLMAAIRGLGIDNIQIECEGGELPIMDGSAASFVFLLRSAGLREQSEPRRYQAVSKKLTVADGEKSVTAEPHDGFFVDYEIDFAHPMIGVQRMALEITPETFVRRIAKARTFGFAREVEYLHKMGLALGGSLENAVVLDEYSVVNPEGLRFKDEFVRHKILDFVGDMALSERPLLGKFTVRRSGHALNNAFLRAVTENSSIYLEDVLASPAGQAPMAEPETVELPGAVTAS